MTFIALMYAIFSAPRVPPRNVLVAIVPFSRDILSTYASAVLQFLPRARAISCIVLGDALTKSTILLSVSFVKTTTLTPIFIQ